MQDTLSVTAGQVALTPAPAQSGDSQTRGQPDTPSSGPFQLLTVRHRPGESPPLLAVIAFGKQKIDVPCKAGDLQTFGKFQARVAELHGIWLRHEAEEGSRYSHYWRDEVSDAFSAGGSCP